MYLVTGASGFLGRHFFKAIDERFPSSMQYLPITRQDVDITNSAAVKQFCAPVSITGVVHFAAESRTVECERNREAARQINVHATANLLNIAQRKNGWFLYVSTDMVFNGKAGQYDVESVPSPVNEYARTKVASEHLVRQSDVPWCIVRPALIYGDSIGGRGSSLSWTLDNLRSGTGSFYDNEYRTPVFVDDLVNLLLDIIKREHTGIVHAGGLDRVSRWDFAQQVAKTWGIPISERNRGTLEDTPENEWRPRDLSLNSSYAHQQVTFTSLPEALNLIKSRTG